MLSAIDILAVTLAALKLLLFPIVFVPLEMSAPLRPQQKHFRAQWRSDVFYMAFNGILIRLGQAGFLAAMILAVRAIVPPALAHAVQSQSLWLQVIEATLVADTGYYIAHRLTHRVPFLWKFHAVHHSVEELDWLTTFRVHPVDQIFTNLVSNLPLFVLGFSSEAIVISVLIYTWQAVAIHTNARVPLGALRWFIATPQFHHWHHANEVGALDKNFAAQLPFLDVLGGTLHMPAQYPERYGTYEPVPSRYDRQLLYPILALLKRS